MAVSNVFALSFEEINFSIRFHEKRIYYLNDREHPIRIEVVITNNSPQPFRFKMADNHTFNLDFEVLSPTNLRLEHSEEFTKTRLSNQPVLYREMSLEPGERFGIVVTLSDYIDIDKPGLYTVRAQFFPELNLGSVGEFIWSNSLPLNVRPAVIFAEERAVIEAETGKLLKREDMPPDEVVAYTLRARQKSQWEKFFLYLDLESLYLKKPERARRYQRMSEEERRRVLEEFRKQLRQERVDRDILIIPSDFEILRTTYTPFEATVLVNTRFRYPDYTELKRYSFSLDRRENIWIITDYIITNLGTE